MACRIFLYYIYRNEQNYSISLNNKIDQSFKNALNKLTDYVEKSLMKNREQKQRMGVDETMAKRHDLGQSCPITTHVYAVCHEDSRYGNPTVTDSQQTHKSNKPLARPVPMINF